MQRRSLKLPALAFACLAPLALLAACGGGGGSSATQGPTGSLPSGASDPAVIESVLEACALAQLDEIQAAVALFEAFLDPTGTPPDVTPTAAGTNLAGGILGWEMDVDVDGAADFSGTARVRTAAGAPVNLAAIVLSVGLDVEAIFEELPDDVQIEVVFQGAIPPDGADLEGTVDTQFAGGLPSTASGVVTSADPGCALIVSFADVPVGALTDEIPAATYDVEIETATETLTGQVVFDGTSTVEIELAQEGRDPVTFLYDLDTEVLTPVS